MTNAPGGEVERLREALREAHIFISAMLASPFWKEAVEPVRDEVRELATTIDAALKETRDAE